MKTARKVPVYVSIFLVLVISIYYMQNETSSNVIGEVEEAVDAYNSYAFKQYNQYADNEEVNIFFSPYSISTCLSMIYEGARGETAKEMQQIFEWSTNPEDRVSSTAYIYNKINNPENECEIHSANAVWAQEEYPFTEEYINVLEAGYGGKAVNIDFRQSDRARNQINEWVELRTNNKIQDLFEEGMINADTRMVLTNALYFRGDWKHQFYPGKTRNTMFNVSSVEQVSVDMMNLRDKWFNYTETDMVQVLEMDYLGEDYSMIIILPKETDLEMIENSLDYDAFSGLVEDLEEREMVLSIPKFSLETKYKMNEGLSDLGMSQAFTPSADFSGVSTQDNLWLGYVVHQTYVSVGENGTEAAAATGGIFTLSMPRGIRFRVDHPFIFAIMEKETGLILFMGRVIDPS